MQKNVLLCLKSPNLCVIYCPTSPEANCPTQYAPFR